MCQSVSGSARASDRQQVGDLVRQQQAGMRHGDQQRRRALHELVGMFDPHALVTASMEMIASKASPVSLTLPGCSAIQVSLAASS